jgi:hypothetical protein
MLAIVAEEILGKRTVEDFAEFFGHLQIGSDVDAEPLEFVGLVAGADAQHQAPVRQRVCGRDLGQQPRRVIERQDDDRGAEPDLLGDRGTVGDQHQGRRAKAVIGEMMLGEPGNRVAELVREPGLLRDLGKNFCCRLFGVARPHQIEDAKFHRPLLRFAACRERGHDDPRASSSQVNFVTPRPQTRAFRELIAWPKTSAQLPLAQTIWTAISRPIAAGKIMKCSAASSGWAALIYRSNPRTCGGRELFVDHVPRIQDARRLQQDHFGFFVGSSAMLDTAGYDNKFARPQLHNPVPELDPKPAAPDQKHLFHIIVVMPWERPLHLHQLDLLAVHLGHDLGLPLLRKAGKLFGNFDGFHLPSARMTIGAE